MQLEAQEKLSEAAEYYEYILSKEQTNLVLALFLSSLCVDGMETTSRSPSFIKKALGSDKSTYLPPRHFPQRRRKLGGTY